MEAVLASVGDSAVAVDIYPAVIRSRPNPIFYQRHVFVNKTKLLEPRFLSLLNTAIVAFDGIPNVSRFKPYFEVAEHLKISQREAMIFMAAASVAYPDKFQLLAQPTRWSIYEHDYSLRMAVVGAKVYPMLRRKAL